METKLLKVYQNDIQRKKYNLSDHAPHFQYEEIGEGAEKKHRVTLKLNENSVIISDDLDNRDEAKENCLYKIFAHFDQIDDSVVEVKGFDKGYHIYNAIALLVLMVLFSPFFLRMYDIGLCIGVDVNVRRTTIIENRFERYVKRITNGDRVIIRSIAQPYENDSNIFEAITTKDIEFTPKDNKSLPVYILPKNNPVRVNNEIDPNTQNYRYVIRLVTFERDGKEKNYVNENVPHEYINQQENFIKYNVFSKHGFHVVKQRYIMNSNLDGINWYSSILNLYYEYVKTTIHSIFKRNKPNYMNAPIITGYS